MLVFLLLDPPEEFIDGSNDRQLGGGGGEDSVQLEGLGHPAQHNLGICGIVHQLQRPGATVEPVMKSKIE